MPLPNFFLIGPPKAGTTSLYHLLRQHPDIFMSQVKEIKFMAYEPQQIKLGNELEMAFPYKSMEQYTKLFADAGTATAIGDASVQYWFYPVAPHNIKAYVPQARIISVLRHPVERFYSHYMMYYMNGEESRTVAEAIDDNCQGTIRPLRSAQNQYVQIGYYDRHLQRYEAQFSRAQIGLWLFEDLKHQPGQLLQSIFSFLNVEPTFKPDNSVRYNPSGLPRSSTLHWLLKKRWWTTALRDRLPRQLINGPYATLMQVKQNNLEKPPLDPALRQRLLALYREDTLRLQDRLQRDLSTWLE